MKKLLFSLFLLGLYYNAAGQPTPQHVLDPSIPTYATLGPLSYHYCGKSQSLYKASEFPGAPAGMITHLYLRSAEKQTSNVYFRNMTIKMAALQGEGGVNVDTLVHNVSPYKWYNTTSVYYSPSHTVQAPIDSGDWIQFALQQPFYYDGIRNFLLEFSFDSSYAFPHFKTMHINTDKQYRGYFSGCYPYYTSNWYNIGGLAHIDVIGFDIQPAGIDGIQSLSNLNLYPNPSNGIFSISFDAKQKVKDLRLTITNLTGSTVLQEAHRNVDGRFTRQMDLSNMPRGIYFAEILADGEKVTRKVVVQ